MIPTEEGEGGVALRVLGEGQVAQAGLLGCGEGLPAGEEGGDLLRLLLLGSVLVDAAGPGLAPALPGGV